MVNVCRYWIPLDPYHTTVNGKCLSVLDTPGSLTPDDNNDAEMNNGDDVDKYYHHDH